MEAVQLAYHEFAANYLFEEDGLAPFFAADRQVKEGGGSQSGEFTDDGDRWRVTLYYQDSGIVHPGMTLPTGTPWELEEMREFRLSVRRHPEEDPVGQQSFNVHIAPRWQGMQVERSDGSRSELDVPPDIEEGINVRVAGSNIAFGRYLTLLRRAASEVGLNWRYFEEPHPYSNVQDAEKYARLDKDVSGPVHSRDGPIASMGHLLERDRQGYRKVVQNDTDDHGNDLPGYYHTVTLDPRRVQEAFPSHDLPVEVKHYYAKEAANKPPEHPLAHPKLGASYQASRWDGTLGVMPEDLGQLESELDRVVYSVLADAGLDISPTDEGEGGDGAGPFVPDAYFELEVAENNVEPVTLDLTRVRQQQESVVIRQVADGLSPVQWESLQTLVTDGGEIAPADIASEHGRHVDSVRRALRDMDELVHREYAEVSLRSEYVAEMVHDAVTEARESLRTATETTAKALEAAERGLDETMTSFIAWAARHGVDVDGARDARMELRFHGTEVFRDRVRAIKEGFEVWTDAGMDPVHFREAQVRFDDGSAGSAYRWLNV